MITNDELFEKFMGVEHLMHAAHRPPKPGHGPAKDPSRGMGRALALLKLHDGIPTRDMAEILGIRVSSLNETLARMEAEGLVVRKPSEEDGRVMLVCLTQAGRDLKQPGHDMPKLLFDSFDEADRDKLASMLDTMTANLEGELGEEALAEMREGRKRREEFFAHGPHGPEPDGPRGPHGPEEDEFEPHEHGSHGHGDHGGPGGRGGHGGRGGRGGREGFGGRGGHGGPGGRGGHHGHGCGPRSSHGPERRPPFEGEQD